MNIKYEGSFVVDKESSRVFKLLTNPRVFARTFPGYRNVSIADNGDFIVELVVNIGSLRGDATVRGRFIEITEYRLVKVSGTGIGVNSTLHYTLTFTLSSIDSKTRIDWVFEGVIEGLASLLGSKVLDNITKILIDDIISRLKNMILES
ncbi:MAG: SRPBCC domain-containing protein [Acidilobaceae archaeon]